MEKLLDYSDYALYRFTCECLSAEHALDFSIEIDKDHKCLVEAVFSDKYIPNQDTWCKRIKNAFRILLGKEFEAHDVFIRAEDLNDLIAILNRAKSLMEK